MDDELVDQTASPTRAYVIVPYHFKLVLKIASTPSGRVLVEYYQYKLNLSYTTRLLTLVN